MDNKYLIKQQDPIQSTGKGYFGDKSSFLLLSSLNI